jgi:hypothetical protein
MAIIAAYYGLPTLSVRAAVFHQMLRNQHGYRVGAGCPSGVGWGGEDPGVVRTGLLRLLGMGWADSGCREML